jgi:hypothetical protein
VRLSYARWLLGRGRREEAEAGNAVMLNLARRHGMRIAEADAWEIVGEIALHRGVQERTDEARKASARLRCEVGYQGFSRS